MQLNEASANRRDAKDAEKERRKRALKAITLREQIRR